jgi:hypothetical protein
MTSTIAIAGTRPPDGDDVERLRHPASTSLSFATQCVCRTTKTVRHPHRGMLKLPARVPHLARFPRITRIDMTTRRRPAAPLRGDVARYDYRGSAAHFSQPRALFELFDDGQRERLFSNVAEAMVGVPQFIVDRQLELFDKVHEAYGAGVRRALETVDKSKASVSTGHAAE